MAKLKIETGTDNEILRQVAKPVKKVDKTILKLIQDMKETMDKSNGVGLAAPQVGQSIRVIVTKFNHDTKQEINVGMVNPQIVFRSETTEIGEEGCLSVPGQYDNVLRSKEIIVKFLDEKGREMMLKLQDLSARIVQHEIDHLDGILFIDKIVEEAEFEFGKRQESEEDLLI